MYFQSTEKHPYKMDVFPWRSRRDLNLTDSVHLFDVFKIKNFSYIMKSFSRSRTETSSCFLSCPKIKSPTKGFLFLRSRRDLNSQPPA